MLLKSFPQRTMNSPCIFFLLLFWAVIFVPTGADAAVVRPNVIFILVDDLGLEDTSILGHPYAQTPNIDRLAIEGTWFEEFYVNSPVCTPTRVAFMTGRYPSRFNIHGHFSNPAENAARGMPDYLDPNAPTITDILKQAGYTTAHFGKWHLGEIEAPAPSSYGIDSHRTTQSSGPGWSNEDEPSFKAQSTDLMVDETIAFIQNSVAHRKNFFVNFWTLLPHAPLQPTEAELAPYKNLMVNPWDFEGHMIDYIRMAPDMIGQMRTYLAAVSSLDRAIGRLLNYLDSSGLSENTVIFFASDNGPEDYHIPNANNAGMGSPGRHKGRKRSLFEGGIRSPMIIRWPGAIKAGYVDSYSIISGVDLLPTICAMTNTPIPNVPLDGEDLTQMIFTNEGRVRTTPLFWEWRYTIAGEPVNRSPRFAVRSGRWKLLSEGDGRGNQLYDIFADPEERHDQVTNYPDVVQQMDRLLRDWRATLPAR